MDLIRVSGFSHPKLILRMIYMSDMNSTEKFKFTLFEEQRNFREQEVVWVSALTRRTSIL